MKTPALRSERFLIRVLEESDVTDRYLRWFAEPVVARFIKAAKETQTIAKLKAYVTEKYKSDKAVLLGIFVLQSGKHVGNIKFEPINRERGAAVVGVMIGDPKWRGKGVFSEVFATASDYLRENMGVLSFWLGVEKTNFPAIITYRKAGFREAAPSADIIGNLSADTLYMNFHF